MQKVIALLLALLLCASACSLQRAQDGSAGGSDAEHDRVAPPLPPDGEMTDAPSPDTAYIAGLTREQWQGLQDEKARYEALDREPDIQEFSCVQFIHLDWEEQFAMPLVDYVGADAFEAWMQVHRQKAPCFDIYSFAAYFDIDCEAFINGVIDNQLTHIYDIETMARRFAYFGGDA